MVTEFLKTSQQQSPASPSVQPDSPILMRCLWLSPVTKNTGHPAAFPPALPEFFIRLFTQEHDLVLDPFAGSGTTIYTAERLGRRAVGIEINPEYCKLYNQTRKQLQVVRGGGDTGE